MELPGADLVEAVREALSRSEPGRFAGLFLVAFLVIELLRNGTGKAGGLVGLVVLTGILLVHELGHAAAMLLLGHRDVRVYLVPLVGGLTTGTTDRTTALRKALVSLAGPLPGLFAAAGITAHAAANGEPRPFYVLPLVLVNALNLLPLGQLDGGRVIGALLVGRAFWIEVIFSVLSVGGLGVLAWSLSSPLIGALSVATLLLLPARRAMHEAADRLRASWGFGSPEGPVEELPGKDLGMAIHFASQSFSGQASPAAIAQRVRIVAAEARTEPAGIADGLAITVLFAAGWAAALWVLATR